ncbi:unnamed protein product [Symbiodinium natans]|uniref:Uncharacterized protein n=1 Tax=Symbiodinium natans TaxID=878477 RepID=A0A812S4H5_9DINO|nr:unnamed protein product [Symbiodinium natans]
MEINDLRVQELDAKKMQRERAFMAREDELAKEERARDRIKSLGMEAFPDLFQKVSQPLK